MEKIAQEKQTVTKHIAPHTYTTLHPFNTFLLSYRHRMQQRHTQILTTKHLKHIITHVTSHKKWLKYISAADHVKILHIKTRVGEWLPATLIYTDLQIVIKKAGHVRHRTIPVTLSSKPGYGEFVCTSYITFMYRASCGRDPLSKFIG